MSRSFLYETEHQINQHISIIVPTVADVIKDEDAYFGAVSLIVATPYDMMVQLDDNNIDFAKINDWELFCLLFNELQKMDLSLVFKDLDLRDFKGAVNKQNGDMVLFNEKTGAVIDRSIHNQICVFLRRVLGIEKSLKKPGNEEARKYMIERARRHLQRQMKLKKTQDSQLEKYIIALVNTSEFPYNYDTVKEISIYQFYSSLHQIIHKIEFDNLMIGCYAGTVNVKEIDQNKLSWIPI